MISFQHPLLITTKKVVTILSEVSEVIFRLLANL
jgi:hypothetical protein